MYVNKTGIRSSLRSPQNMCGTLQYTYFEIYTILGLKPHVSYKIGCE